ncbi:GNAT family N-acetyltransferase [Aquibacillus rhizosphaerae]|uniref:GNAT family N-acetyltransferase n=1 Tax=Aquibacillus rhizosphaerae TaxID=3051431 RepID=A0ABT7LAW9_9BACI|nr:GNAT family N-acetyltransferase [Aquibacillus sp. LR5S19]MDL4843016.1 GNAT family N-acetyltransferase [Aquibacillus sp. LR5S19]
MNIILSEDNPKKDDYINLHQTTGWNAKGLYTYDQLYTAICNSWYSISIYENKQLIGYGRMISDGIYQTLICDVMVHPDYQNLGIGTKVMNSLLGKCNQAGIKWVQLFSAKGKFNFYEKLGFKNREVEAPGMSLFL